MPGDQEYGKIKYLREFNSNIYVYIDKMTYIEDNNIIIDKHLKEAGTAAIKVGSIHNTQIFH